MSAWETGGGQRKHKRHVQLAQNLSSSLGQPTVAGVEVAPLSGLW